jgi:hypothetical protein
VFQPDGDYLTAMAIFVGEESRGHHASSQVLRFTATGQADPIFADPDFHFQGSGGPDIEALVNALAVAPNGDIVVAGQQTFWRKWEHVERPRAARPERRLGYQLRQRRDRG